MAVRLPALVLLTALVGSAAAQEPQRATFVVRLPAEARLYVDDTLCPLTGATRTFLTIPLPAGRQFNYTLRAERQRGGEPVSVSRRVAFQAGEVVKVDFGSLEGKDPVTTAPPPTKVDKTKTDWQAPPATRVADPAAAAPVGEAVLAGMPPRLNWAAHNASEKLLYVLLMHVRMEEYDAVEKIKGPDGKPAEVTVKRARTLYLPSFETFPFAPNQALYADGTPLAPEALKKQLDEPRPVLVAAGRDEVDPRYLAAFKPKTILLRLDAASRPVVGPAESARAATPVIDQAAALLISIGHDEVQKEKVPPTPPKAPPAGPFGFIKRLPPEVRSARIDSNGTLHLRQRSQAAIDWKVDDKRDDRITGSMLHEVVLRFPATHYKVYDAAGKPLAPAELGQRLRRERIALICYGDQLTDAATLALVSEDTPVIVLSLEQEVVDTIGSGYSSGLYP